MSSEYFFLVAEASAISSAPKTMSRGTFFSRARTSTSITSSLLPAAIALTATNPSQFRYQLGSVHILQRQRHRLPFELHAHLPRLRAAQHADEPAPAACIRGAQPNLGPLARE